MSEKTHDKYVTLAEVRDILNKAVAEREELNYEQKQALHHAESFAKLPTNKTRELLEELLTLEFVPRQQAYKIADLLPLHEDDVRAIFTKNRTALENTQIAKIIETVGKYYVE
ncbi:MAG: RNA polymerase [Thermoplasmata archaeon HGW-Thermoplasmata-1]|nr:MAG: RNA polymerase [Thermoplasmata archaeon HGW-Thermoplasmata-1]